MRKEITNFRGITRDPGIGKYPEGSLYDAVNCVRDRQSGSMMQRYGYSASLAAPTITGHTFTALDEWLSYPITQPTSEDIHLWFAQDEAATKYIFAQPYWHNSSTKTSGWVNINESKSLVFGTAPTVTGTPTNTIVAAGTDTCTTLGLSTTANYYKNWTFTYNKSGGISVFLITGYSVTTDVPTFTFDQVIDNTTGSTITGAHLAAADAINLHRYFHYNKIAGSPFFSPSYTDPDGYSTDLAVRFSGGMGSTTGYKNLKMGYVNRLFFASSGASVKYQWTGSYCDEAECKAPVSTIFTSLTMVNAQTDLIKTLADHNFVGTITWTVNGGFYCDARSYANLSQRVLWIFTNNVNGTFASQDVYLPSTSCNALTADSYTLKIRAILAGSIQGHFQVRVKDSVSATTYDSPVFSVTPGAYRDFSYSFTSTGTGAPIISIIITDIEKGYSNELAVASIALAATSGIGVGLSADTTYKLFASAIYDGFQESELTYLGTSYVQGHDNRLSLVLNQKLAELNKFQTGFNIYVSVEQGDTTLKGSTTTQSRYLTKSIPVDDSATSAWVFSTTTGKFSWTGTIDQTDIVNSLLSGSWEQNTGRTSSTSTTCSYSMARAIAGRFFVAQDYDYADGRSYTNRVRYNSVTSAGLVCPDIFPNLPEQNITVITSGNGTYIRNINELRGSAIIRKDQSTVRLTTSDPVAEWRMEVVSNSIGGYTKKDCIKLDAGLMFYDKNGLYFWDGGAVTDVSKDRFKYFFKTGLSATASNTLCWFDHLDKTFNLIMDRANSSQVIKIYPDDMFFVRFSPNDRIYSIAKTSNGTTYFATSLGAAYVFDTSATDATVAIRPYLETQIENSPEGQRFFVRSVRIGLSSSVSPTGTIAVTLRGGNGLVTGVDASSFTAQKTWSITPDTTHGEYRFIVPPDVPPMKFFKVSVNNTVNGATSTAGDLSFHSIAYEYDLRRSVGDVLEQ